MLPCTIWTLLVYRFLCAIVGYEAHNKSVVQLSRLLVMIHDFEIHWRRCSSIIWRRELPFSLQDQDMAHSSSVIFFMGSTLSVAIMPGGAPLLGSEQPILPGCQQICSLVVYISISSDMERYVRQRKVFHLHLLLFSLPASSRISITAISSHRQLLDVLSTLHIQRK